MTKKAKDEKDEPINHAITHTRIYLCVHECLLRIKVEENCPPQIVDNQQQFRVNRTFV